MSLEKKDFYGKEVAAAIKSACGTLGVSQEKLDIEVVETGTTGIFGLIRKKAHIRVLVKPDLEEVVADIFEADTLLSPASEDTVETEPIAPAPIASAPSKETKASRAERGQGTGSATGIAAIRSTVTGASRSPFCAAAAAARSPKAGSFRSASRANSTSPLCSTTPSANSSQP